MSVAVGCGGVAVHAVLVVTVHSGGDAVARVGPVENCQNCRQCLQIENVSLSAGNREMSAILSAMRATCRHLHPDIGKGTQNHVLLHFYATKI